MNAVEGVDYIFDRYAYLGLTPGASRDKIRRTIARRRAQNHPDKLSTLGPEIQAKAAEVMEKLDCCASILLNDQLRPLYIERLAEFKTNNPELVRADGNPVIVLGGERIDLGTMLAEHDNKLELIEPMVRQLTGYNPKQVATLGKLYAANPEDTDLRDSYRDVLSTKLGYLTQMEMQAWIVAGVQTSEPTKGHLLYADEYGQAAQLAITHARETLIPQAVEQRRGAVAIGVAKPPLLLTFNGGAAAADVPKQDLPAMTEQVAREVVEAAQARFATAAKAIEHYAGEKQKVLEELVPLSPLHVLYRPEPLLEGNRKVYLLREGEDGGEPGATIVFNFLRTPTHTNLNGATSLDPPVPLSVLQQQPHTEPSIAVQHNSSISSIFLEPTHAIGVLEKPVIKPAPAL